MDLNQSNVDNIEESTLPYNASNIIISESDILSLLNRYGLDITEKSIRDMNISIFRNAFVHKSYCTRKNENFLNGNLKCPENCLPLQEESNERLEFLGDAILNVSTAKYLFDRYPNENEGFLTKLRTKLVNGTMLAHLAILHDFSKYVIISKQIEEGNGRTNKKIMEDCFEAFLGAILLNTNFDTAFTWITTMFEETVDFADLLASNTNYKDAILKYFQHNFSTSPVFLEMNADTDSSGSKVYKVCLKYKGNIISIGIGSNKKQAENDCAKNALTYYGQTI